MRLRGEALNDQRAEVYSSVVEVHRTTVQNHVECLIEDHGDAADLVSEVFALAWLKLDAARPLGLTWLLRAADNKLKDRERRLRAQARAMEAVHRNFAVHRPHDLLDTIAVRLAIEKALMPREKKIVMLFYWDRLAAGEIAELLTCSQSSVFTTLTRARAKLELELTTKAVHF